jgi:1-acyl-sn-glycerol-3-phosphate acyltransferase
MEAQSHISRRLVVALWPFYRLLMRFYFRIEIRDRELLPTDRPIILAPTHRSKWDGLILTHLAGRPLRYLANRNNFVGVQGWFLRRLGSISINVENPGPRALRHCRELLEAGEPLVVFPEATIYYYSPGEVHPIKPGAAWLALPGRAWPSGVSPLVVPIRLAYGDRKLRFGSRIEVIVGEPIDPDRYEELPSKDARAALTADLQRQLGDIVNTSTVERFPAVEFLASLDRPSPAIDKAALGIEWVRGLDPALRASIRELHRLRPAWNLVILLYLAVWLGAGTLVVRSPAWPIRLACYAAIGVAIHSLAILMHEAIHSTLFRRRRLDRWAGFLLGAPALFSMTAYKVAHLVHHRHTRTGLDPDDFTNVSPSRALRSLVFYAWLVAGMLAYLVHVPLGALRLGRPRERVAVVLEYALMALAYGGVFWLASSLGRWDVVIHAWAIPLAVAIAFGNARSWAEHALTDPGHPLTQTRTVTSNRLTSFLMCNLNYHLEHHLFPGVPWYNLPRVHDLLREEYRAAGAFVHRSYLRYLCEAARVGVHGKSSSELA